LSSLVQEKGLVWKNALLFQANGCPLVKVNELRGLWFKKKSLSGKKALLFQANGCP
jgi:hypothetical protein